MASDIEEASHPLGDIAEVSSSLSSYSNKVSVINPNLADIQPQRSRSRAH